MSSDASNGLRETAQTRGLQVANRRPKKERVLKYEDIDEALFKEKIRQDVSCWIWTARIADDGYGQISINRQPYPAHRVAYVLWVGEIPKGLVVNHLCRNRACVNPKHLEAVTHEVATNRGDNAKPKNKTHCPKGHLLTSDNKYVRSRTGKPGKTWYGCLQCRRDYDRLRRPIKTKRRLAT